ncbi:hypothetical protein LSAT2_005421, partial [Lamellibrachia satsuma]
MGMLLRVVVVSVIQVQTKVPAHEHVLICSVTSTRSDGLLLPYRVRRPAPSIPDQTACSFRTGSDGLLLPYRIRRPAPSVPDQTVCSFHREELFASLNYRVAR